jgi:hypothetical protein
LAAAEVVPAVAAGAVEHVEQAAVTGPDDEVPAERLDAMRAAVAEVVGYAEAVPATRESLACDAVVQRTHLVVHRHGHPVLRRAVLGRAEAAERAAGTKLHQVDTVSQ